MWGGKGPVIRYRKGGEVVYYIEGPLTGGPQCCMSILRNGNVPCRYFCNFHVDFKIAKCRLSNLRKAPCHLGNIFSHVDRLHVASRF